MKANHYNRNWTIAMGAVLSMHLAFGQSTSNRVTANESGLAGTAWPKFHGSAGNTGSGAGSRATDNVKWTFAASGFDSSPAIGPDGTLYAGSWNGYVYALDGATGNKKWCFKADSSVQSSPVISADGTVYFGSWDGRVYAVDAATGWQKWNFKTGDGVYASPTIGPDGTVYIGSNDRNFYAIR